MARQRSATSTGPSSSRATATWPTRSTLGAASTSRDDQAPTSTPPAARWCARSARPAGCVTRWPARPTAAWRRDRHARHLPDPRDAGSSRRAGRLRLCDAGARLGRDQRWPAPTSRSRLAAEGRPRRGDRRFRAVRAGRRLRRRGHAVRARASTATQRSSTARRPGYPTAASPTSTSCSRAPARRPARAASRRSSCEPTRPGSSIAERIDMIAPHPLARCASTAAACRRRAPRRARRRLQDRHAHARRLPHLGGRGRARLRTPRAGRGACARARRARCSARALADFQLTQAKLAEMATTIDSAALLVYRAAWQRDQGRSVTREAAMAKLTATEGAQQVIDAAVQLWGGQGVVSGHRSSACTARSARCASTKARPKCSS